MIHIYVFVFDTIETNHKRISARLFRLPGNGVLDPAGMPGSNAGNLPETLVGLPRQLFGVPSACHTLTCHGDLSFLAALTT